jgi:glutathione S-transferase
LPPCCRAFSACYAPHCINENEPFKPVNEGGSCREIALRTRRLLDLSKWPNAKAYMEHVTARPKMQEALKAEGLQ